MPFKKRKSFIKKFKSPRKGVKPLTYFKGSFIDLFNLKSASISREFKKYGLKLNKKSALNFKKQISLKLADKSVKESLIKLNLSDGKEIYFKLTKFPKGNFIIKPHPFSHSVSGRVNPAIPFIDLMRILSQSFEGKVKPNSSISLKRQSDLIWAKKAKSGITKGDSFSIDLITKLNKNFFSEFNEAFIEKVSSDQIARVNIHILKKLSKKEIQKKKAFYREKLSKFGVPLKFVMV